MYAEIINKMTESSHMRRVAFFKSNPNGMLRVILAMVIASFLVISCGAQTEGTVDKPIRVDREKAIQIANTYIEEHYQDDSFLKDKTKPTSVKDENDIWVVFYEDKGVVRLPSGVELAIDKTNGRIWRRNQE